MIQLDADVHYHVPKMSLIEMNGETTRREIRRKGEVGEIPMEFMQSYYISAVCKVRTDLVSIWFSMENTNNSCKIVRLGGDG